MQQLQGSMTPQPGTHHCLSSGLVTGPIWLHAIAFHVLPLQTSPGQAPLYLTLMLAWQRQQRSHSSRASLSAGWCWSHYTRFEYCSSFNLQAASFCFCFETVSFLGWMSRRPAVQVSPSPQTMAAPTCRLFQRKQQHRHWRARTHTHTHTQTSTRPLYPGHALQVNKSITSHHQGFNPDIGVKLKRSRLAAAGHFLLDSGRKISMSGVARCCCCCCCCCFMAARFSASILFLASSRALVAERIFCACSGEESGVSLLLAFRPLRLEPATNSIKVTTHKPKHDG